MPYVRPDERRSTISTTPIRIIPRKEKHALRDLDHLEVRGELLAADFYLTGSESWEERPWGLAHPDAPITNVDHHAPIRSMRRAVSSANLALRLIESRGRPDPERDLVVINHLDCDSVLTAGILSGRLPPDHRYGEAAIAADHTGEENAVADLLQGLDAHWSRTERSVTQDSIDYFFTCLRHLERRQPFDRVAEQALAERTESRERAQRLVNEGRFESHAGVYFAKLDEPIEGELLLPLFPDALMVVTSNPHRKHPDRWQMKIRSRETHDGFSLHDLDIPNRLDPSFGGRWNAGSNNRGGGTDICPESYFQKLVTLVEEVTGRG